MKILINEKLSEHKYKTPEGYLVCVDSVLARTGKQTYRRNELFHDGDDTEIDVDRTPEEVFSEATLASFENKPVTVEHPDEDVNVHNYKDYAVGFVRDVKRGVSDGQDVILGTLVITDADTIEEIEAGEHTDLSCGYDCDILDEENPTQRNIRGNHVALCQQGRAGIARIIDSVNDSTFCVEFFENGQLFKTWIEARDEKEAQVFALHANPKAKIRNVYRDSVNDSKYFFTLGEEYTQSEANEIARKYGLQFKRGRNSHSPDFGGDAYFEGSRQALLKMIKGEQLPPEYKNDIEDAKNRLPSQDRKFIANYLRMISTYTSRDVDIKDLLRPLSGHGFNWTIEKIDGWKWREGEYAHKDYYVSINGYDDRFLVTLYADPNQDWKVKEVNAYFTDSVNDLRYSPADIKVGRTFEHRRRGKFKVLKQTGLNNVIIEYENGDKFKTSTITLAEDLNGGIIRMIDSVNDSTYKCEFNLNEDTMWTYVKANSPEDAKREILDKFANAKNITVTGHDSVEDSKWEINTDWSDKEDVKEIERLSRKYNLKVIKKPIGGYMIGSRQSLEKMMKEEWPMSYNEFKNEIEDSVEDKDMSVEEYLELMEQGNAERVYRNAHGNPNAEKAYRKYKGLDDSVEDASRGHEIVVYAENYLSKLGKNNSVGKYDKIIFGVKSLLEKGFLQGDALRRAVEREVDRLLKQHGLDSAMKALKVIKAKDFGMRNPARVIPEHATWSPEYDLQSFKSKLDFFITQTIGKDATSGMKQIDGLLETLLNDYRADIKNTAIDRNKTVNFYKKYVDVAKQLVNKYGKQIPGPARTMIEERLYEIK